MMSAQLGLLFACESLFKMHAKCFAGRQIKEKDNKGIDYTDMQISS